MLQAYPGRDPVFEALRGKISIRQLRVMATHLPPGNPVQREINGPWGDDQRIAHDISSHLRSLVILTRNIHKPKGEKDREPTFLPTPEEREADVAMQRPAEQVAAERDHLQAVLARSIQK